MALLKPDNSWNCKSFSGNEGKGVIQRKFFNGIYGMYLTLLKPCKVVKRLWYFVTDSRQPICYKIFTTM